MKNHHNYELNQRKNIRFCIEVKKKLSIYCQSDNENPRRIPKLERKNVDFQAVNEKIVERFLEILT